jgi:hypothetical protein
VKVSNLIGSLTCETYCKFNLEPRRAVARIHVDQLCISWGFVKLCHEGFRPRSVFRRRRLEYEEANGLGFRHYIHLAKPASNSEFRLQCLANHLILVHPGDAAYLFPGNDYVQAITAAAAIIASHSLY